MMEWIIRSSIQFRFLVLVVAAALMAFGATQLRAMPVDVLPEFNPPFVEIQTEALGLSAEEVEQMITVPMEQDLLAGVAWLDVIRSESIPGLSSVLIYFEPGTDLYRARQMVAERMAQAAVGLPHVSKPPTMIQPLSSSGRFMIVGLSSQELSLIEMSVLARWTIGPRLMGVPGVANVAIWGNRDRQLQVLVDPEQLQDVGVSLQQVVETTGNALWVSSLTFLEASSPGAGGFIDTPNQRLGVWHVLPISSPEELAQVPVQGTALSLRDVAQVVEAHQPLIGDALIKDQSNLLLVIEKLPGINTLEVTRGIEQALDALRPGFVSINFDATLYRPATYIEMAISNLSRAAVIAAAMVVLVLGVFFFGWRKALISLAAIPFALMAALYVLYLRGATLNSMVLAGLVVAMGVIIDEAIIDVEHIRQRLRQNRQAPNPRPSEIVILEASAEMRGAIFFAILITLLAVVPVFFLEGLSGALFREMFVTYALAVLVALAVALVITPALSVILLSNALEDHESPLVARLQGAYGRLLARTVFRPVLAYLAVIVLVVAGLVAIPFVRQNQLLPEFREPYLTIQMEAEPGTSLFAMNSIVTQASSELRAVPGVRDVSAHVGRAVFGDKVANVNYAELWVQLDPQADFDGTVNAVEEKLGGYSEVSTQAQTYLQQVTGRLQSRASDGLTLRVLGEDHQVLRAQAEQLQKFVEGIPGVVAPHIILPAEEPTVEIEVDLASAQKHGVKPGDVRRAAATLLSGIQVGSLFEQQKVFDVVVWSIPEVRDSVDDIGQLLIDTPGGGHVQLGEVAEVRIASSPAVIKREGVSPYVDIQFTVQGRDVRAVTNDIQAAISNFPFELEYHAVVMGDYATQQEASQRIYLSLIVAVFGIYLFLQSAFRSWRMALAALLTLPMALSGGALAALLGGSSLSSLGILGGLMTILGIALRNQIMLIKHYQHLEVQEGENFGVELVLRGSRERIAPILMTALATGLALLPFLLFGDIPGHEIVRPIAIVILGGLFTTTLLNLFVLPALYLRFGASREAELKLDLLPAPAGD
jgi:CzcA family heavy metal efflux pump